MKLPELCSFVISICSFGANAFDDKCMLRSWKGLGALRNPLPLLWYQSRWLGIRSSIHYIHSQCQEQDPEWRHMSHDTKMMPPKSGCVKGNKWRCSVLTPKGSERYFCTSSPVFVCHGHHGPGHLKRLSLRSGTSGLPCVCSRDESKNGACNDWNAWPWHVVM